MLLLLLHFASIWCFLGTQGEFSHEICQVWEYARSKQLFSILALLQPRLHGFCCRKPENPWFVAGGLSREIRPGPCSGRISRGWNLQAWKLGLGSGITSDTRRLNMQWYVRELHHVTDFASKRASFEGGIHPIWPGQRNVLIVCPDCMLVYGAQSVQCSRSVQQNRGAFRSKKVWWSFPQKPCTG